jgi:polyisoprenoid-binding protein YceI
MSLKTWTIDTTDSSLSFSVSHMLVSRIHGEFRQWTGVIHFDENAPAASSVEVTIDASSIDTRDAQRDAYLSSPEFFDAERHPLITFRSRTVKRIDQRRFALLGALMIRGVTRDVFLNIDYGGRMRDSGGVEHVGFAARGSFDRKAFGLTQSLDGGGLIVGDRVELALEIAAADRRARKAA